MPISNSEENQNSGQSSSIYRPYSGNFGEGVIELFVESTTFTAKKTGKHRIRLWGGGGGMKSSSYRGGAGGGFSIGVFDLVMGQEIVLTVGKGGYQNNGETTSFGSLISATGGAYGPRNYETANGGIGVGGYINHKGGDVYCNDTTTKYCSGGAASLLGNGKGFGVQASNLKSDSLGAGAGEPTGEDLFRQTINFFDLRSIDFLATGKGAGDTEASTGGGGNQLFEAGFPAGGSGNPTKKAANGLIIVEY